MADSKIPMSPEQLQARRAEALRLYQSDPNWRPVLRADCAVIPRPCPFVGCRFNTTLDITVWGTLRWRHTDDWENLFEGRDNCALDVAARGPQTLQEIANVTGVCRERVRQELDVALEKIKPYLRPSEVASELNDATQYDPAPEDIKLRALGFSPDNLKAKHSYRKNLNDIDKP